MGEMQRQREGLCRSRRKRREEEGMVALGQLLKRLCDTKRAASLYAVVRPALSSSLTDSYLSDCECNNSTNNLSSRAQLNWL